MLGAQGSLNYPANFTSVNGFKMHYLQQGSGDPVVFVHGMPTWSYLWRNIIPYLSDKACCVAPDLIGMGRSDKPDIAYTVFDHIQYFEGFVHALGLKNITLVLHGWGSVIGLDYARRHENNVKAVAFFEGHIRPVKQREHLSLPIQQLATLLHHPQASYKAIVQQNYLIERLLPAITLRSLTEEEWDYYREPFVQPKSRELLWQYLQELPLGQEESAVIELIQSYSDWLQRTQIPKLMIYAIPGLVTTIDTVQWAKDHLPNITLGEIPESLHFAQESEPEQFGEVLRNWYLKINA